jgi:3-oxoacyl-[acyl-carrier-protein] synthase II
VGDQHRVAVTGLGVVSPIGIGVDAFWASLLAGISGIGAISKFDASKFSSRIAGEVRDFDSLAYLSRRDVVRTDLFIQYALVAATEALASAKLPPELPKERMGVSIGTAMGGLHFLTAAHDELGREGPRALNPYAMPGVLPNMAAGWVAMRIGAKGPTASASTACAAANQAIGDACRMIQRGEADVMIAGGADALVHPVFLGCFAALGALSTRNEHPQAASRPFDKNRDGFVLAEGAGMLVLENLELACQRGAHVYAELAGYGLASEAEHPTALSVGGPARSMRLALADAGVSPEAVQYINAHGTSTLQNDMNETKAIKQVFGAHAKRLAISSIKSMTGHLIGAAGALEAAATALAIDRSIAPPTINYATPDAECDLDYVPNVPRSMEIEAALSNSFAFGGTNATLLFRRFRTAVRETTSDKEAVNAHR